MRVCSSVWTGLSSYGRSVVVSVCGFQSKCETVWVGVLIYVNQTCGSVVVCDVCPTLRRTQERVCTCVRGADVGASGARQDPDTTRDQVRRCVTSPP